MVKESSVLEKEVDMSRFWSVAFRGGALLLVSLLLLTILERLDDYDALAECTGYDYDAFPWPTASEQTGEAEAAS